jgi:phenylacetate-CoA ligase
MGLKKHIDHCLANSPFYRERLSGDMAFTDIPFTEKSDLEKYNDEFLAVPKNLIVDIVMSSGTTGKATKIMYTESDLVRLAYNEKVSLAGCGINNNDVALLTCTLDRCFIAGLAYFSGLRALGAATIRNGHGTLASHLQMIKAHEPTVIVGVPTFVNKLAKFLSVHGTSPSATSVKKIVCIGEPLRDKEMNMLNVGRELEALWNARAYSSYASTETVTTFCECEGQCGGHLHPDLTIVEIIDDDGNVLPPGSPGEVVVTPLGVEGMPLLRFKTGDISFTIDKPCACGRDSLRLGPIIGRKKQMLKIKGTTVYPQAIFAALSEREDVEDYYLVVSSENELSDKADVFVSPAYGRKLDIESILNHLQARLRVKLNLFVEENDDLHAKVYTKESRKPLRFFDKRSL